MKRTVHANNYLATQNKPAASNVKHTKQNTHNEVKLTVVNVFVFRCNMQTTQPVGGNYKPIKSSQSPHGIKNTLSSRFKV